jgi:hypothetical protein
MVSQPSPDIHLVLRVQKLLTGAPDKVIEPYFKYNSVFFLSLSHSSLFLEKLRMLQKVVLMKPCR